MWGLFSLLLQSLSIPGNHFSKDDNSKIPLSNPLIQQLFVEPQLFLGLISMCESILVPDSQNLLSSEMDNQ